MTFPVTAVIIGAGNRGTVYASYARHFPDQLIVVAVADPKPFARNQIREWFSLPPEKCFNTWTELIGKGKLADCAVIAVNDAVHKECALAVAKFGYDILLEKPIAATKEDCIEVQKTCQQSGVMLRVCHVLRYLPAVLAIKRCIQEGLIGDVVNIEHRENIGFWHFSHSFVRGNWRNTSQSSFSLLSKCCHDVDLINFWMGDKKCTKVCSMGSLFYFKETRKPMNSGSRCLQDCNIEDICAYSCKKIYLDTLKDGLVSWPHSVVCEPGENYRERLTTALKEGPYGRCVYSCDNDVCDNQTVQFGYEDGSTATLTMVAFTNQLCIRETKIVGTRGELSWNGESDGPVQFFDFLTRRSSSLDLEPAAEVVSGLAGHGGADFYFMKAFVSAVANRADSEDLHTTGEDALESHLLVFAAEDSRLTESVVDFQEYRTQALSK